MAQGAGAEDDGEHDLQFAQHLVEGHPGAGAFGSVRSRVQKAWARVTWRCQPGFVSLLIRFHFFFLMLPLSLLRKPWLNFIPVQKGSPCRVRTVLTRSEEHTSELQSLRHLVCRLL